MTKLKLFMLLIAGLGIYSTINAGENLLCNVDSPYDICNSDEECLQIMGTTDHRCVKIAGRNPSVT